MGRLPFRPFWDSQYLNSDLVLDKVGKGETAVPEVKQLTNWPTELAVVTFIDRYMVLSHEDWLDFWLKIILSDSNVPIWIVDPVKLTVNFNLEIQYFTSSINQYSKIIKLFKQDLTLRMALFSKYTTPHAFNGVHFRMFP